MVETLFYKCSAPFFVPPTLHGYRGRVGNLDVIELRRRSKFLPYVLRMECQVTTKEQAALYDTEARQLARDLKIVWPYVVFVPLFPKYFMVRPSEPPDGWHTNFNKLKTTRPIKPRSSHAIASPGPAAGFTVGMKYPRRSEYRVDLSYMPLQRVLAAIQKYRVAKADIRLRPLMDLHVGAIDQLGMRSQLFLYAKAAELARSMLPGKKNSQKEAALPPSVRHALRHHLHWLFGIANSRFEIRHAVKKSGQLWPKLSPTEESDFVHDADLVIRGVVEASIQEKETYNTSYEAEASPTGP